MRFRVKGRNLLLKTVIGDKTGSVTLDTTGAQLVSLRDADGREYLWQGDPKYWSGQAPVLFPIVGSLRNNRATAEGKSCEMLRHGIARRMDFARASSSHDSASFLLKSNEETRKRYPFDFEFTVSYCFRRGTLTVGFTIRNTGEEIMPYAVGGHPAFNCPLEKGERFEDYDIVFPQEESVSCPALDPETGLLDFSDRTPVLQAQSVLPVSHGLFAKDALVFDSLRSDSVSLKNRNTGRGVRLGFAGFPFLGIWSAANDAPFVALEPWTGCATAQDEDDDLFRKRGMTILKPEKNRSIGFTISLI